MVRENDRLKYLNLESPITKLKKEENTIDIRLKEDNWRIDNIRGLKTKNIQYFDTHFVLKNNKNILNANKL